MTQEEQMKMIKEMSVNELLDEFQQITEEICKADPFSQEWAKLLDLRAMVRPEIVSRMA